ncbi:MAG TPA: ABC transporter ATP-binding protein [Thermoleophilaceae bacterium]|nr:ABC transporter ATP-binding protein [Thermoleophilaceae bacterium]
MRLVTARSLVKTYGEGRAARRVLDGADLHLDAGELVALVGPSGCGKSTLLHLIGGLDRPDGGSIELAGRRLEQESERGLTELRRREVGFVFQFFHLIPELTGEENVLLPTRLSRNGGSAPARARRLIEELGLAEAASRRPAQLSGGEQQRLSIARALANDPALLLADEPTGNLDQESGHQVLALLRQVASDSRGVLLVTHDAEAASIADRVLRLEGGRLVG